MPTHSIWSQKPCVVIDGDTSTQYAAELLYLRC